MGQRKPKRRRYWYVVFYTTPYGAGSIQVQRRKRLKGDIAGFTIFLRESTGHESLVVQGVQLLPY